MPQDITIVIPCRLPVRADITIESLRGQTFRDFSAILVADMEGRGAPWARNQGASLAQTEFILFSDDDIYWKSHALRSLLDTLRTHPEASYSYGAYEMDARLQCDQEFDANLLRKRNFISTMSLIRTVHFPGFDERIQRLQDWDLWLTMLEQAKMGAYCGKVIFSTNVRSGITYGSGITYPEAAAIVKRKHGLS